MQIPQEAGIPNTHTIKSQKRRWNLYLSKCKQALGQEKNINTLMDDNIYSSTDADYSSTKYVTIIRDENLDFLNEISKS